MAQLQITASVNSERIIAQMKSLAQMTNDEEPVSADTGGSASDQCYAGAAILYLNVAGYLRRLYSFDLIHDVSIRAAVYP